MGKVLFRRPFLLVLHWYLHILECGGKAALTAHRLFCFKTFLHPGTLLEKLCVKKAAFTHLAAICRRIPKSISPRQRRVLQIPMPKGGGRLFALQFPACFKRGNCVFLPPYG